MRRPETKEHRYFMSYVLEKCQDNLDAVRDEWIPIKNEFDEVICTLPRTDFLFKL